MLFSLIYWCLLLYCIWLTLYLLYWSLKVVWAKGHKKGKPNQRNIKLSKKCFLSTNLVPPMTFPKRVQKQVGWKELSSVICFSSLLNDMIRLHMGAVEFIPKWFCAVVLGGLLSLEATASGLPSNRCPVSQGKSLQMSLGFSGRMITFVSVYSCMEVGQPEVRRKKSWIRNQETWILVLAAPLTRANSLIYLGLCFLESDSLQSSISLCVFI